MGGISFYGFPDAVPEEPSGFHGAAKGAVKLPGRDALLAAAHEVEGLQPDVHGRRSGKSSRPGLWKCYACRKQFTVRIGTIFEFSHVPLHIWLQAFYLMCSSKKGIAPGSFTAPLAAP